MGWCIGCTCSQSLGLLGRKRGLNVEILFSTSIFCFQLVVLMDAIVFRSWFRLMSRSQCLFGLEGGTPRIYSLGGTDLGNASTWGDSCGIAAAEHTRARSLIHAPQLLSEMCQQPAHIAEVRASRRCVAALHAPVGSPQLRTSGSTELP